MTTNTAISVLGKCLDDPFALVVIARDNDGRISNAKLIANDLVITNINLDALTRLATYTWTQFVIIDKEKVSVLLTRDPEYVFNAVSFEREKFRLRDSSKREGSSRPSSSNIGVRRGPRLRSSWHKFKLLRVPTRLRWQQ